MSALIFHPKNRKSINRSRYNTATENKPKSEAELIVTPVTDTKTCILYRHTKLEQNPHIQGIPVVSTPSKDLSGDSNQYKLQFKQISKAIKLSDLAGWFNACHALSSKPEIKKHIPPAN